MDGTMKRVWKMSQVVRIYCGMLLVLFILVIVYLNVFALREIRTREQEKGLNALSSWASTVDGILKNHSTLVENFVANNSGMVKLVTAKTDADTVYALIEIQNILSEYALLNDGMNEFFFYSAALGDISFLTNSHTQGSQMLGSAQQRIVKLVNAYEESGVKNSWLLMEIEGGEYLFYVSARNGNYMGCWCTPGQLIEKAAGKGGADDHFFITDLSGVSRTDGYLEGEPLDLTADTYHSDAQNEDYIQLVQGSKILPASFVLHIEKGQSEAAVLQVRNVMVLMCMILGILLVICSGFLESVLYRPIRKLVLRMVQIADGDFELKITDFSNLYEIQILNETFNQMVSKIEDLKIRIYEEQLREQKIQLQFYQQQLRPHFLANALNTVRAMIDMEQYSGAQDMCCYIADYYRYLTQQRDEMILLSDELNYVDAYVNIQKLRWPDRIRFTCQVEEACSFEPVPSLLIQPFVENSFKYWNSPEQPVLEISVRVRKDDRGTCIEIRDNGAGFPEDILSADTDACVIKRGDRECVGIRNAFDRLWLFYGEAASIHLSNDHGALVRIQLP